MLARVEDLPVTWTWWTWWRQKIQGSCCCSQGEGEEDITEKDTSGDAKGIQRGYPLDIAGAAPRIHRLCGTREVC